MCINDISNVIDEELDMFKNKLKEERAQLKDEEKINNLIENTKTIFGNNLSQIINNYNKNQINLLKIAVNFYKENNLTQMDFNNEIQINSLINFLFNQNIESSNIIDKFKYITHDKRRKRIKFIFNSFGGCLIDIPIFFTKKELYSLAEYYKSFFSTNIILIHDNKILKNDESPLDEISNNDIIWIIEDRLYPDNSYYLGLKNKCSGKIINIFVNFRGEIETFHFCDEVTIQELIRAIVEIKGYAIGDCVFLFNSRTLDPRDKRKIKEVLSNMSKINCVLSGSQLYRPLGPLGKEIKANFTQYNWAPVKIGTLDPIKKLFAIISVEKGKIIIGNVELKFDSENYLSFYGINEDFNCILKTE